MAFTKADIRELLAETPMFTLSVAVNVMYYGWVPFLLYLGVTRTEPRPTYLQAILPLFA